MCDTKIISLSQYYPKLLTLSVYGDYLNIIMKHLSKCTINEIGSLFLHLFALNWTMCLYYTFLAKLNKTAAESFLLLRVTKLGYLHDNPRYNG